MFGIIMAIATCYQDNELIAVFTSGISIYKFVVPLIVFCLIMSFTMIFIDSYIVIPSYRYRENYFEHITHSKKQEQDITLRGNNNCFWSFEEFLEKKNMLLDVMVFKIDDDSKIILRIDASTGYYTKNGWIFTNGILREWDTNGELKINERFNKRSMVFLTEKPDIFKNVFNKSDYEIEKMTIQEAKERIKLLKTLNIDYNQELRDYYKKFSFPFTLLIVCLFAIGVSTLSQKNILILSLFFSIGLAILYYIAQMILDILAANGSLHPFLSAWLGIVIFIPIALIFMKKAKT
jgi:lipopolysaccharide export system permease protein